MLSANKANKANQANKANKANQVSGLYGQSGLASLTDECFHHGFKPAPDGRHDWFSAPSRTAPIEHPPLYLCLGPIWIYLRIRSTLFLKERQTSSLKLSQSYRGLWFASDTLD